MGHEQERGALAAHQLGERVEQARLGHHVELLGRLVEQEQARAAHQRARHQRALALARPRARGSRCARAPRGRRARAPSAALAPLAARRARARPGRARRTRAPSSAASGSTRALRHEADVAARGDVGVQQQLAALRAPAGRGPRAAASSCPSRSARAGTRTRPRGPRGRRPRRTGGAAVAEGERPGADQRFQASGARGPPPRARTL